jgi:GNAT superfamily N-acetyltransferase
VENFRTTHDGGVSYRLEDRVPTPDEHRALAVSVDWEDHFDWPSIAVSLERSTFGAVITHEGTAVAMGRIVGDGIHYFYLQDVIVHPDHSDQGLATQLTERLLRRVADSAPAEAFVGLFASDEAIPVYESAGFTTADATGMHRFVQPGTDPMDAGRP